MGNFDVAAGNVQRYTIELLYRVKETFSLWTVNTIWVYQIWKFYIYADYLKNAYLFWIELFVRSSSFMSPSLRRASTNSLCFCLQPQHTNVCFWYIPPSLRGMPDSEERREKLHRVWQLSVCWFQTPPPHSFLFYFHTTHRWCFHVNVIHGRPLTEVQRSDLSFLTPLGGTKD